ncbi:MAG: aminopeptidase P family protein [Ktedonobacteraceae bacterium]|nr:aminopeptidase P family protein [Ktedonobacteraceae bacterium]
MKTQRAEQIKELFKREGYHALVCRTPQHVVMLTGYQPLLGDSFCIISLNAANDVETRFAVLSDEMDLVPPGIAVEVKPFAVETMDVIRNSLDAAREPLGELLQNAGVGRGSLVGYEGAIEPLIPAYTQLSAPSPEMKELLHMLLIGGEIRDATDLLNELDAIKTEEDLVGIRRAETVALHGFQAARGAIAVGATEAEVAAATYAALVQRGYATEGTHHIQPHVHVMTGARAALAYKAFNLTSNATIAEGDTVTVQMEIGVNGYWAELTRSFFAGTISDTWSNAHRACVEAQDAALKKIRADANAHDVDAAARQVMQQAGFGSAFKHGLGHGFGFQAINHAAAPVLHPASKAILRPGMVHNMEPAVYLDGQGGFRLNDNVAVQTEGNEVLSSKLPRTLDWLVVQK